MKRWVVFAVLFITGAALVVFTYRTRTSPGGWKSIAAPFGYRNHQLVVTGTIVDETGLPVDDVEVRTDLRVRVSEAGFGDINPTYNVDSKFELKLEGPQLGLATLRFLKPGYLGEKHEFNLFELAPGAIPVINGTATASCRVVLTTMKNQTPLDEYERITVDDVENGSRRIFRLSGFGSPPVVVSPDWSFTKKDVWYRNNNRHMVLPGPLDASTTATTSALLVRLVPAPHEPGVESGSSTKEHPHYLVPPGKQVEIIADDGADGGIIVLSRSSVDPKGRFGNHKERMDLMKEAPATGYQKSVILTAAQIREMANSASSENGLHCYLKTNGYYSKAYMTAAYETRWRIEIHEPNKVRTDGTEETGSRYRLRFYLLMQPDGSRNLQTVTYLKAYDPGMSIHHRNVPITMVYD